MDGGKGCGGGGGGDIRGILGSLITVDGARSVHVCGSRVVGQPGKNLLPDLDICR